MARPRKPINYEDELMRIDAQITKWKKTIKELEEERTELLKRKEQEEMHLIYEELKRSGLSPSEFVQAFSERKEAVQA